MIVPANAPAVARGRERMVMSLFPEQATRMALVDGITNAIYLSFKTQGVLAPTYEDKRIRFKILMDWALVLRGDLQWGVQRIVDTMPEILKVELSGQKWEPSTRQCWIPGDGG